MNIIKKLYDFTTFIEITLFIPFILQNMNNLQSINYQLYLGSTKIAFTLDMYFTIPILAGVYAILLVLSNNLAGLNEEGTMLARKLIGIFILQGLLTLIAGFYLTQLGQIGTIILLLLTLIFGLKVVDTLQGGSDIE